MHAPSSQGTLEKVRLRKHSLIEADLQNSFVKSFQTSGSLRRRMNSLLSFVQFKSNRSHSFLVDIQQKYLRNVILFGTGLCAVRLLFGDVISCQGSAPSLPQHFLDMRCYVNGTTTDLQHGYYQFTSVYLYLLAFAVQLPFWIWSQWTIHQVRDLENLAKQPELALLAIYDSKNLFLKTITLEAVYALYWIGLLFLTNEFFNGYWSHFSWSWKAIPRLFPDMGNCYFNYFHSSGDTVGTFKCLLPLSSVYRRVFAVLYWIIAVLLPCHLIVLLGRLIQWIWYPRKRLEREWAFKIVTESLDSWNVRKILLRGMSCENDVV